MSTISIVGGDFWTAPASNLADEGKAAAVDGITDIALFEEGNKVSENLQWLNGLSPDQLTERTWGNFDEGGRVTTYGDLKTYRQTETDLGDQIALLSQSGTDVSFDALDATTANSSDIASLNVSNLLGNLQDNKSGALRAAQAYLLAAQGSGQFFGNKSAQDATEIHPLEPAYRHANSYNAAVANDTASVALTILSQESQGYKPGGLKAAQGNQSALQDSGEFLGGGSAQSAFDAYHAEIAYRRANPHGNWSATDAANVA